MVSIGRELDMARKKKQVEGDVDFATGEETPLESADTLTELPPLPKEKVSLAPIGVLTIVLSLTTLVFLFFSSFSEQHTYIPTQKAVIPTEIKLSATQFQTFSNSNVCDGKGLLAGLPNAKLVVAGNGWSRTENLGTGSLNTQGQCVFSPSVTVPDNFSGGGVTASIIFSSARSQQYPVNVGPYPPYKTIQISLSLG
jgi:hypothetical protein